MNARDVSGTAFAKEHAEGSFDIVVGDLSFISLTLVLPTLVRYLAAGGDLLMLVKPQFELQPEHIGKGGIVKDARSFADVETRHPSGLHRSATQGARLLRQPDHRRRSRHHQGQHRILCVGPTHEIDRHTMSQKLPALSLEFFPPKTPEGALKLQTVRQQLYALKPGYCSVTYGAGGSTQDGTLSTVREILGEGADAGAALFMHRREHVAGA